MAHNNSNTDSQPDAHRFSAGRYLQRWNAEFADPAVELVYRKQREPLMVRQLRYTLLLWALLFLLFMLPDWLALGASQAFFWLATYRLVFVACLLGGVLLLNKYPVLATDGRLAMWLALLGHPFFFLYFVLRPDVTAWILGVIMVLQISVFLYLPGRVGLSLWVALFGWAGSLATLAALGMGPAKLVGVAFVLALPAVVGYYTALRLERMLRGEYSLRQQVMSSNAELRAEIERRKALEAELERQATTDPLTGLCNRRHYEALYERELNRCRRQGTGLSIAMLDLDHFKSVNDTHGHEVGDQALVHTAEILRAGLRCSDVVGRFGGEEFILMLPDTPLEQARVVVERVMQTLRSYPLSGVEGGVRITATVALTEVKDTDGNLSDTLKRVDVALYQGKAAGRDQLVLS
ncbi:GGDEF domain-containing protein [Halopseudomonas yangmingensis]|uniref:diguanylate cyclase n=1 Tax=Halopseudomonas yangmingensis TaxID=1720063 RepID=A0A1I4N450_9GAMM|nr:diguanylate cyclase [Halopseudomonas yangmingensis]SFM10279.1 diguanylate cyclase (GGDEF) domain-containing protein [Halopseudomonas yangmingensis]